jgi:hypothetical protein
MRRAKKWSGPRGHRLEAHLRVGFRMNSKPGCLIRLAAIVLSLRNWLRGLVGKPGFWNAAAEGLAFDQTTIVEELRNFKPKPASPTRQAFCR